MLKAFDWLSGGEEVEGLSCYCGVGNLWGRTARYSRGPLTMYFKIEENIKIKIKAIGQRLCQSLTRIALAWFPISSYFSHEISWERQPPFPFLLEFCFSNLSQKYPTDISPHSRASIARSSKIFLILAADQFLKLEAPIDRIAVLVAPLLGTNFLY